MMQSYLTPILVTGTAAFINDWYTTKTVDLKIPLDIAIAAAAAALLAQIPGMEPVITGIGWVAFVAWLVVTANQKGSVVEDLTNVTNGL
jgi:hypothetical protein